MKARGCLRLPTSTCTCEWGFVVTRSIPPVLWEQCPWRTKQRAAEEVADACSQGGVLVGWTTGTNNRLSIDKQTAHDTARTNPASLGLAQSNSAGHDP